MPINNIPQKHTQLRLMESTLSAIANPNNKLYKLKDLINWNDLNKEVLSLIKISDRGREKKDLRMMVSLVMLQAMYNLSDLATEKMFEENFYWQLFCGFDYVIKDNLVSESSIRRFRQTIGEAGMNSIMKELTSVARKCGLLKKKDLEQGIIDTTVQIKNIKYPHDAHLLERSRKAVVGISKELGIVLNETYEKYFKYSMIKLWKFKKDSKSKSRLKILKLMKTRLGRIIRIIDRFVESNGTILDEVELEDFKKAKNIYNQSCLTKKDKEKYKETNKVVYSFHEPEVECIGKGKLNKPYEFGNKVSVAVSREKNFVIGIKSFHGNPYDGHTLKETKERVEEITGVIQDKMFVDNGYRGHDVPEKKKVFMPSTKRANLSEDEKKMIKRRSAVEPIIGHLKQYGRMARNYLRGKLGDILNPIISAIGFNMRNIVNYMEGRAKKANQKLLLT